MVRLAVPNWVLPVTLVIAAFLVRLMYLNQVTAMPTFEHPVMDEQYHVSLADRINSPAGYGNEPYYRAPLYPYLFALIYRVADHSLYWSRIIQITIGSLLPLLVLLLGTRLFGRRIALWGAAIAMVYPTFLYHDVTILITSLKTLLAVLLVWQLYRTEDTPTAGNFAASGLLLGLASLARPNFLVLFPALALWVWVQLKDRIGVKSAVQKYLLLVVSCVVVILPVTIRNYVAAKDVVLIAWQGGFNFFLGNNRAANGWSATAPGIDATWEGGYKEAVVIAENQEGRPLKRSEVSDFWYQRGWQEIQADPGHFAALTFKKTRLFFQGYEIPNNEDPYNVRQFSWLIRPLLLAGVIKIPFGILAPLALLGIGLSLRHWRKYLILYVFLAAWIGSFLFFFVCARYRQPLLPFLILFAVAATAQLVDWFQKRRWKNLSLSLLVLILLIVESNHSLLGIDRRRTEAENQVMFGTVYLDQNRRSEAETYFRSAVAADPTFAPAHINLAIVCSQTGQTEEAVAHYRTALELEPYTVDTYLNFATLLLNQGDRAGALNILERARQANPLSDDVHVKLAMTYFELGHLAEARQAIGQALRLNPQNSLAQRIAQELVRQK
ncbi:MAG: tetratricopeptide repeat protein [Candidatus Zixiibacteriota bacterium]